MIRRAAVLLAFALFVTACSGFLPSRPGGKIVPPETLHQYAGIGSMSTLWYLGSDKKFHHFSHLVKVQTRYRVRRSDLDWTPEFALREQDPVHVDIELGAQLVAR